MVILLSNQAPPLTLYLVSSAGNIHKQFGSRSGPTFCRAWSGSKLFETDGIPKRVFQKSWFWKKLADDKK